MKRNRTYVYFILLIATVDFNRNCFVLLQEMFQYKMHIMDLYFVYIKTDPDKNLEH
jgi:hypothetical protein